MKMKMEFASEEAKHFFITHTHTTSFFILFDFSKGQKGQKEQKEQKRKLTDLSGAAHHLP